MSDLVPIMVRPETLRDLQEIARLRGIELPELIDDLAVNAKPDSEDEQAWEKYRHMLALSQSRHLFE